MIEAKVRGHVKGGFCFSDDMQSSITGDYLCGSSYIKAPDRLHDCEAEIVCPENLNKNELIQLFSDFYKDNILDRKQFRKMIENLMKVHNYLDNINWSSTKIDSCIYIDRKDRIEMSTSKGTYICIPSLCDFSGNGEDVLFENLALPKESIKSKDFDFRDFVERPADRLGMCVYCKSMSRDIGESLHVVRSKGSDRLMCHRCVYKVTFDCARLSNNENLKSDLIAKMI